MMDHDSRGALERFRSSGDFGGHPSGLIGSSMSGSPTISPRSGRVTSAGGHSMLSLQPGISSWTGHDLGYSRTSDRRSTLEGGSRNCSTWMMPTDRCDGSETTARRRRLVNTQSQSRSFQSYGHAGACRRAADSVGGGSDDCPCLIPTRHLFPNPQLTPMVPDCFKSQP
ncbi:hypothetical protein HNR46_002807 [Haloferula luteola]|uniref:Uncharacterized protein n=1 Tax=Haloferula luteola TaxID=595692 RepID=A0A840VIM9_9BACT|nr:hypothetical protein [Haloferula luteola]